MPEAPVADASPVIVLARAGELDLLHLLGDRILIPAVVAAEVRSHSDEATRLLAARPWFEETPLGAVADVVAAWDLGAGESAVLTWALSHPGSLAVIDDFAARKCASTLGIPVKGTLGLALLAKRKGRVRESRPLVDKLRRAGLYLSDSIIREALALVGE